jgi:hypothetical protein
MRRAEEILEVAEILDEAADKLATVLERPAAAVSHNTADGDTDGGHGASYAPAASSSSAGIPQNNGGDQDADNNGGPSDGDGNI